MIHFIEHHGIECLVGYYFLISVLGTMPPLPDTASYWQKWGYAAAHAFCGNIKQLAASMGQSPKQE